VPAAAIAAPAVPAGSAPLLAGNLAAALLEREFLHKRVLQRDIFICNSPATVQEAFVDQASAFERKSPQMRHALCPLLGDGLPTRTEEGGDAIRASFAWAATAARTMQGSQRVLPRSRRDSVGRPRQDNRF
jgi:hypothetical protein